MSQSTAYYMCAKKDSDQPVHLHVLTEPSLNSVSYQCACDKSSVAPKVQSKHFQRLITFQKYNPPDFNFHPRTLTDKNVHYMV